ncbi:MAG: hypothetical protein NC218_08760 [Acetobacter sp.]|nr:hypothetical protein [Acetobacter sp.]
MAEQVFLLSKYFKIGWLSRRYYDGRRYHQPYSAEDRLLAGERFYADFMQWNRFSGTLRSVDCSIPRVDGGIRGGLVPLTPEAERFRRALRRVSRSHLPVIYKIVLEEKEIKPQSCLSARERLYFNDEVKGLLCRGLDELASYYRKIL